jgi:hypothetical protein
MQAKDPPEKGAGEIARDALCDINPVVRTVLSLAPSETIKTAPKRKKYEQALGLIGKPVKKRKSGTGKEKAVDEILRWSQRCPYVTLCLAEFALRFPNLRAQSLCGLCFGTPVCDCGLGVIQVVVVGVVVFRCEALLRSD